MKKFFEILVFILMISSGIYYLFFAYTKADETFVFYGFVYLILIFLFVIFLGLTFRTNLIQYNKSKNMRGFIPSLIGAIFIFSAVLLHGFLWYQDSSEVILQANYDGDINGSSFEFRKDGTYLFENSSVLGGSCFRGNYIMKDSLIIIDKNEIDKVIKTNTLAIRKSNNDLMGRKFKIVQIDRNHNRIDKEYFDFKINFDKR